MLEIITLPENMTNEWLSGALKKAGVLPDGQVESFEFEYFGTGKMGDNARLTLKYSRNAENPPKTIIAKLPAQDETARMIAGYRGAYYSEVMFYKNLAAQTTMRTPTIFGAEVSEDKMDFILLMEDMAPAEPGSQLVGESKHHARIAMKESAKLAAAFYGKKEVTDCDYVLTPAGDDGGQMGQDLLVENLPAFLDRFGHGINTECQNFIKHYANNHKTFVSRYQGPKTLAHADFRSENILFLNDTACTVDWQTVMESSPLTDFAYFMGGSVDVEDRRLWEKDLVHEYSEALARLGVTLSADECWEQYREQAMHGLLISVLGACFSEADERSDAMFLTMIQRHLQHCVDMDSGAFLK